MFTTVRIRWTGLLVLGCLFLMGHSGSNTDPSLFCSGDGCTDEPFREFCKAAVNCSMEAQRDGFHTVRRSQPVQGGFESIAHVDVLFWRTIELGQTSFKALSPSGRFALFTTPEGYPQLFDGQTRNQHDVSHGNATVVIKARWTGDETAVWVTLRDVEGETRIQLPR